MPRQVGLSYTESGRTSMTGFRLVGEAMDPVVPVATEDSSVIAILVLLRRSTTRLTVRRCSGPSRVEGHELGRRRPPAVPCKRLWMAKYPSLTGRWRLSTERCLAGASFPTPAR